jgi:hypothetical protein
LANTSMGKKHPAPQNPTMIMGSGAPLMVGSGSKQRLFCDGGGLCSPGLWEPQDRWQPQAAKLLQQAIRDELHKWEATCPGVRKTTLAKLCTGNVTANPFPEASTRRLQLVVPHIVGECGRAWLPHSRSRAQPIDVRGLGAFMQSCGDPDYSVLHEMDIGVPIGFGVDLPRTPAVFPPKERWSLPEQEDWGEPLCTQSLGQVLGRAITLPQRSLPRQWNRHWPSRWPKAT